ncbi:MAG TPA: DNA photolyase family protein [Rickettsia endosymbiont of Diachasma alloeum]|nr:DNA photolyase family protein [Rickettsia endosymbiont of Diachasma alloeum]
MNKTSIVWLRRNLRLHDNKSFAAALRNSDKILPIFIFDTTILERFKNPHDRRLSFLANTLCLINDELKKLKGKLLVFYGKPLDIIPKFTATLKIENIYADEDYEPSSIERDKKVQELLGSNCTLNLYCDHLLIKPDRVLTKDTKAYKVYTPYMQAFRKFIADNGSISHNKLLTNYSYNLDGKLYTPQDIELKTIDLNIGESEALKQIGYVYKEDELWQPKNAQNVLDKFITRRINRYKIDRDFLYLNGTSTISPYLRFGLISIRECYRKAFNAASNPGSITWINELIWREFYATILYHFPNTINEEFLEKYKNKIPWNNKKEYFDKFINAETGYPIIDAAVKQLVGDGWMHNRARMIVASFFSKNLLLDWRKGEEFFAQYLMDYELASNVGGWQWASSCGTDAQPYFRIFNPYTQGKNFDQDAEYIKKYLPILKNIQPHIIHNINFHKMYDNYPKPIVDYGLSRARAIEAFKEIGVVREDISLSKIDE